MTFLELQNAVLSDRFSSAKRADAKRWINYRYGRLWSAEDWSFKRAIGTVSVGAGVTEVAMGDFQTILGLWDASLSPSFSRLGAQRPEDYYGVATLTPGVPDGFTVVGNTIYLDRPAATSKTYKAIGELKFIQLSADGESPLLPSEFHQTLVSGAAAQGLREENDPTWKDLEADFQAGVDDMKKAYLTQVRTFSDEAPPWP